jgi:hypothetical protein
MRIIYLSLTTIAIWFALLALCILPVCAWITSQFNTPHIIIGFLAPFFLGFASMVIFEIGTFFDRE